MELTDQQLEQIAGGHFPQEAPPVGFVQPDLENDEVLSQVAEGTYEPSGRYKNLPTAPFEFIRDNYELGDATVVRGAKGFELLSRTDISEDQERAEVSGLEKPHLQSLQHDVDLMKERLGPLNFWQFAGDAGNLAPSSLHTLKGSGVGGLTGGLLGAGVGAFTTKTPAGALRGAQIGARIGSPVGGFAAGAQMNMGNVYLDLREKGVTKDTATKYAVGSGILMGAMEYFGLRQMSGVARKAFAKQLETPAGKQAVAGMIEQFERTGVLGRVLEGAGSETATEVGQELTQLTAEALSVWADTGEEVWNSPKFWDEVGTRVSQTAVQTARGSLFMAGGSEVAGTVTGKATAKAQKTFQSMVMEAQIAEARSNATLAQRGLNAIASGQVSMNDVFNALKGALNQETQAEKDKALEQILDVDEDEALDALYDGRSTGTIIVDEDGNTLVQTGISVLDSLAGEGEAAGQAVSEPDSTGQADAAGVSDGTDIELDASTDLGLTDDDIAAAESAADADFNEANLPGIADLSVEDAISKVEAIPDGVVSTKTGDTLTVKTETDSGENAEGSTVSNTVISAYSEDGRFIGRLQVGVYEVEGKTVVHPNPYVDPRFRRSGVATALYRYAEESMGLKLPNNPDEQGAMGKALRGNPVDSESLKAEIEADIQRVDDALAQTEEADADLVALGSDALTEMRAALVQSLSQTQPVNTAQPAFDFDADEEAAATGGLSPVETQARINQINTDLQQLVQKERQLGRTINTKMEKGFKVDSMLERMEKILQQKETLELEKELLQAGLTSRDEVAGKRGQTRISVLSKLVDRLKNSADQMARQRRANEKKVAKAAGIAYKRGQFAEQKTIRSLQNQLIQIINAATNDRNFRQRLKTMVNKVSNRSQFNTAAKNIQKELKKLQQKKADAAYKAARQKVLGQIERMLKDRVRYKNGNPTTKTLDADTVARLKQFREYLSDQKAAETAIQDFLNNYLTQLQNRQLHLIPPSDLESFQIAQMAYDLDKKDLMSLNVIAGNVAQWLDDGRNEILQKQAAIKQQRQDERTTAYQSVGVDPDEVRKAKSISKRKKRAFRQLKASTLMWNTLMEWISPKDPTHAIAELTDTSQARDTYLAGKEMSTLAFKNKLQQALAAVGSKQRLADKIYSDSRKTAQFDYVDQNGNRQSLELDRAQLLEAWLKMKDDSLHASMRDTDKGNGWTLKGDVAQGESFQEAVEALLSQEDIAIGQAILDFYQDYHARFNKPYRDKYGVDLPMRDNYSPVSRKGYMVDPGNSFEFGSLLPGAAISRTNTLLRVELQNPYAVLENHVAQVERFIAYDSLVGTMRNVFGDSDMRDTVRERYGRGTVQVIDDYIERFVQNRTTNWADSDSLLTAAMSDLSLSALTLKSLHQYLVQMTSLTAMWANYSPMEIVKGIATYAKNLSQTEAQFRTSATLAHRYKSGASYEFGLALRKNGIGLNLISAVLDKDPPTLTPKYYQMVSNVLYGAMRLGDAGVVRAGGGPVYWAEIAKGKTESQALMRVSQLMEQTQQGDDASQMPSLYANNQYAYLFGGMFALQPLQLLGLAQTKVNDFVNNPTPRAAIKLGGQIAALWIIPGFLYGLVRNIPLLIDPPDDDELERETLTDMAVSTLMGPGNATPLIGDVIERAWWASASFVTGEDAPPWTQSSRDNPIAQLYSDPERALKAWMKLAKEANDDILIEDDTDKQAEEQGKALAKTIKAVSRWGGVSNSLLNMPGTVMSAFEKGDYVAASMAVLGASPAKIRQRLQANTADEEIITEDEGEGFNWFGDTDEEVESLLNDLFPEPETTGQAQNEQPVFPALEFDDTMDEVEDNP